MNVQQIAARLMQDEVVAYPTEAVFGLGCNPLSESAVRKLLDLKQRPIEKGLILVAPSLHFLQPFVECCAFTYLVAYQPKCNAVGISQVFANTTYVNRVFASCQKCRNIRSGRSDEGSRGRVYI